MSRTNSIAPGALIQLRDAVWRVQRVDIASDGQQVWRCIGVSEIVRDLESVFLQSLEPEALLLDPESTQLVADPSSQHRAGLLYIESLLRDVPPPSDGLYVGHRAAMDVLDFQLEPAWLALGRPRQRILIADAVGLGKTLEAGILLSELIRRGRARRILVATTKSMLTQFQKEMWARFTIPLVRLDSRGLARIRAELPSHHNPFYHFDRTIISIDTLKQNNWFRTHVEKAHWDVVVIDEAHNVATRGGRDSQRASIAGVLARNCDSLILLSATPHDGKAESFASLMQMLDPTAIANPSEYTQDDIEGLYVRRFKADVADQLVERVPEPTILEARSTASAAEERAFDRLTSLDLPQLDAGSRGGLLFRTGLVKAIFSSPAACLEQLRSPLRRKQIQGQLGEDEGKLARSAELSSRNALRRAAEAIRDPDLARELRALAELAEALEAITPPRFSKYQQLLATLDRLRWTARSAKEDRLVIFTERRETLRWLEGQLMEDLGLREGQLEVLHGQLSDLDQQRIVEDFGKAASPLRLLLASDVASEGLNLHYLCHRLVHFDMPWSLMVFQQRNGRVDRYGQTTSPQIVYLRTDSENEEIRGDQRILDVLRRKAEQARENLGDPSVFMGVYDVESEEALTAAALEAGSAQRFEAELESGLRDPFALLLDGAALTAVDSAPTRELPSLFASDFDFLTQGLEVLREEGVRLQASVDAERRLVELVPPQDLRRRLRRLPAEVQPEDGVLLMTADADRMQRSLAEARREESAWPRHHFLWANSPVLGWLQDRARAAFGRHQAPVLVMPGLGDTSRSAIIVSGLLPNRRGQPLVHRWYVVRFRGTRWQGVEPFEEFLRSTRLGEEALPNDGQPRDLEALEGLLPEALQEVRERIKVDRDRFRADLGPQLVKEKDRLRQLEGRQLDFIDQLFEHRKDALAQQRREAREQRVRNLFEQYQEWIEDAMTMADEPFLQIVAAFVGAEG